MRYTSEQKNKLIDLICARISKGESTREIVKSEGMPDFTTLLDWVRKDENYAQQYARAMELRAENMFEDLLTISDDGSKDYTVNSNGEEVVNQEAIQRSRLRVDTRKWVLSRMNPKKYGDRTTLAGDPEAPLVVKTASFE